MDAWLVVTLSAGDRAVSLDDEAGREPVSLVGRLVVELSAWLVERLPAWLVGWWSSCQLGRPAGCEDVCEDGPAGDWMVGWSSSRLLE